MVSGIAKQFGSLIFAALIAYQYTYGQTNVWNGLTPLHSTRGDVEKLLGKSEKKRYDGDSVYQTDLGPITIAYASKRCDRGWDVPADTVLKINVPPPKTDANKSAEELKIDQAKYFVSGDDAMFGTWTNPELGIQYHFNNMVQALNGITYIPLKTDNLRRCNGYPPYVPEASYYAYDTRPFYDLKAGKNGRMDDLDASLSNLLFQAKRSQGRNTPFALVYFDQKLPLQVYRDRLAQFRRHAKRMVKMLAQDVQVIEAGINHENSVEFYLLPKEWKPPAPNPELPSPQFMNKAPKRR